ncbi:unnamed protein product [Tilletia controversa]|nr:unnamed protein product [Tilletia controversa]CAD6950083.1 unnamed protein product [Tilletia controversa]CAD6957125.1 unnamed protein product [Tilletia controversa]CAD6979135.1 unnamed protein product [Tilletia controversa]CAD6984863.1 unnamed protein product [Tilletia controversa]
MAVEKVTSFLSRTIRRPRRLFLLCVVLTTLSAVLLSYANADNPVSHFFAPSSRTYEPTYSALRERQARHFLDNEAQKGEIILAAENRTSELLGSPDLDLALVLISIRRPSAQYLDLALGSTLDSLSPAERKRLHISVVIADAEPETHPFFTSPWLHALTDEIVVRAQPKPESSLEIATAVASYTHGGRRVAAKIRVVPRPEFPSAAQVELSDWHRQGAVDYAETLDTCSRAGTPHCVVLEDDIVLTATWHQQVRSAIAAADARWPHEVQSERGRTRKPWAFIRLFYAEKYFGWEDYEVPTLICVSAAAPILTLAFLLIGTRGSSSKSSSAAYKLLARPSSPPPRPYHAPTPSPNRPTTIPLPSLLILSLTVLAHTILIILAGRNHIHPIPPGLSSMPRRGCCTQATIFPNHLLPALATHLRAHAGEQPYDVLMADWAVGHAASHPNARITPEVAEQERRAGVGLYEMLALNPAVVQHIGHSSSQAGGYQRADPLWSFAFERKQPWSKVVEVRASSSGAAWLDGVSLF